MGAGQQAAPASGKMVPLGGGGWHPAAVIQLHASLHASTEGGACSAMPGGRRLGKVTKGERRVTPQSTVSRRTPRPVESCQPGADGGPLTWRRCGRSPSLVPSPRGGGGSGSEGAGGLPKVSQLSTDRTMSDFLVAYSLRHNPASLNGTAYVELLEFTVSWIGVAGRGHGAWWVEQGNGTSVFRVLGHTLLRYQRLFLGMAVSAVMRGLGGGGCTSSREAENSPEWEGFMRF